MSIAGVKTYARARMRSLGYTEWMDGFNFANIPSTLLNSRFHVALGDSIGISNNQDNQTIESEFTIRIFRQGTADPKTSIDTATTSADTVITDLLRASNRLTQTEIKNVRFNSMAIEPIDVSNDNGLIVRMSFTALVIISTR